MSTVKTTNITHGSNSGTNNIILDDTGKVSIATKKLYCPGTIIQVQYGFHDTEQNPSGNTTWTDVGPTASITPTANTSKIKVTANASCAIEDHNAIKVKIVRTKGGVATDVCQHNSYSTDSAENNYLVSMITVDDPYSGSGTVGQLDYKIQIYVGTNYGQCWFNFSDGGTNRAILLLEEIAG